jgi:hypothetical protein
MGKETVRATATAIGWTGILQFVRRQEQTAAAG